MRLSLVLALIAGVNAHFLWLQTDTSAHTCTMTFGETAAAGNSQFLDMLLNITHAGTQQVGSATPTPLKFTKKEVGSGNAIAIAPTSATAPFLLEATADFGVFSEGGGAPRLLKYYANSDRVIYPNDWFGINAISKSMLEVTLRDPYTNQGPTTYSSLDNMHPASAAGDQCPPGDAWFDGEACVVAMAQFNQTLISREAGVNITTFGSDGTKLGTYWTPDGIVILRFPNSTSSMYASVNYQEMRSGSVDAEHFDFIDHWATTSAILRR